MTGKLRAYTILEVTVAMLLSAVSIAIAYTAFSILNKSYKGFDSRNKELAEFVLADKLLKRDFSEAKRLTRSETGIIMQLDSGIISYDFNEEYILRDQYGLRTDTLHLATIERRFTFEQEESNVDSLVDKVQLNTVAGKEPVSLVYSKMYSAEDLFE